MKAIHRTEPVERLVRVRATRRGAIVNLLVHYEIICENGCTTYRIVTVDETS